MVEAPVPKQAMAVKDQKKDNLEAYENEAFEALAKKTPKVKSVAAKAKPAAVTKGQVLKRPAAAKAKAVAKTLGKDKYGPGGGEHPRAAMCASSQATKA